MNKQEFIDELRGTLAVELGSGLVEENVKYYETYINSQIRQGKSEEQVMAELGSPRLIAKSIVEAVKGGENIGSEYKTAQNDNGGTHYRDAGYHGTEYRDAGRRDGYGTGGTGRGGIKVRKLPTWLLVLIVVGIVGVVISLLVAVVWWLAPVILIIWFVTFLVKMIKRSS